jgi:hypothetical protein
VDNAEAMDPKVIWLFENHYVEDVAPPLEGVFVANAEVDKSQVEMENAVLDFGPVFQERMSLTSAL